MENLTNIFNASTNFVNRNYPENKNFQDQDHIQYLQSSKKIILIKIGANIACIMSEGTGSSFLKRQMESEFDWVNVFEKKFTVMDRPFLFSTEQQIDKLKEYMGLNVSEIAMVMKVSRATIYSWIDDSDKLRYENEKRLNEFVEICLYWKQLDVGRLGGYLHKIFNHRRQSLLDLLKNEQIDKNEVFNILDDIAKNIKNKKKQLASHEQKLKEYGFKELTKEERNKNLDKITRKIGK